MKLIVFDIETTDLFSIGQILNYAFYEVELGQTLRKLTGNIDLSSHQLPSADAIDVTKIDIENHLQNQYGNEREHMHKIHSFLTNIVERSQDPVMLIGHNISRFDLNFLRTSMIRNGLNPYLGRGLVYGDTLHLAKKYFSQNPIDSKISLKLTDLTEYFSSWVTSIDHQAHTSEGDVLATIDLIGALENFGISPEYKTYELGRAKIGTAFLEHVLVDGEVKTQRSMLISENRNYALVLNLDTYSTDGPLAVSWKKKDLSTCLVAKKSIEISPDEYDKVVDFIENETLKGAHYYDIETYFKPPACDIENHIYKMPYGDIDKLSRAINGDRNVLESAGPECKQLYLRSVMHMHPKILRTYVHNRYVNQSMIMQKHIDDAEQPETFAHWTLKGQYQLAKEKYKEKKSIHLKSLIKLYENFAYKFDIEL